MGTSYPAITDEKLLNLRIAIPLSIEEQKRLVKEIAVRTASIETAIENQKKQITILTELRNRIMLDVVTGQVDVRDGVAQFDLLRVAHKLIAPFITLFMIPSLSFSASSNGTTYT